MYSAALENSHFQFMVQLATIHILFEANLNISVNNRSLKQPVSFSSTSTSLILESNGLKISCLRKKKTEKAFLYQFCDWGYSVERFAHFQLKLIYKREFSIFFLKFWRDVVLENIGFRKIVFLIPNRQTVILCCSFVQFDHTIWLSDVFSIWQFNQEMKDTTNDLVYIQQRLKTSRSWLP